jgi:hypothetical protein
LRTSKNTYHSGFISSWWLNPFPIRNRMHESFCFNGFNYLKFVLLQNLNTKLHGLHIYKINDKWQCTAASSVQNVPNRKPRLLLLCSFRNGSTLF